MQEIKASLPTKDGHQIPIIKWLPQAPARAVIHIVHGMAEHCERYRHVAEALTNKGYAVFAHDHRGHGRAIKSPSRGHFGSRNGWELVIDDLILVQDEIKSTQSKKPIFLLGHSMGSFICQDFIIRHGKNVDGVVLSGSNYSTPLEMSVVRQIAKFECWREGPNSHSALIRALSFDSYERSIKNRRSRFDWLSRDSRSVRDYILDPLCGFPCTNKLWEDLLSALIRIFSRREQDRIPKALAIRIIGGKNDPISKGKGLDQLASSFEKVGLTNVSTKIYSEGRHEILNEINKTEVLSDLIEWLDVQIQAHSS